MQMNKNQLFLLIFFCIGTVLIPLGLQLNQIRIPLTTEEINDILKDPKKTEWCRDAIVIECPLGPFPSKAPYEGIGQSLYFAGVSSFAFGIVTILKSKITTTRRFLPHWIFFAGVIIVTVILVIIPIRIPILDSQSFCVDPLCFPGPYHTQDPAIVDPILYGGIAIASSGVALYLIKYGINKQII